MVIGIDASRAAKNEKTGTENYSYSLIKAIARADRENRYVLYFNKPPQFFDISQPNISTRVISAPRFWTQGRLAFECLIKPPEILFLPAHTIPVIRRPILKTVVTIHDLGAEFLAEYHQWPQKIYLNWSTEFAAKTATHLIAVSNFTKKDLIRALKVPASRISVVYEGVDGKVFYPRPDWEVKQVKSNWGIGKDYFLYVGTIQPRKNLVRLIEGFSKANLKHYDLVIAGSPGWLYGDIYEAPKKFGVDLNVKFVDYIPSKDLPTLYSGALALLFPSLYEGFGLPILEAFACSCPVVTSKVTATVEVASNAAILVDPFKVEEITRAISRIASSQELRKKLIEKGKKRVGDYSWEKTAKETIKVFEKVYQSK